MELSPIWKILFQGSNENVGISSQSEIGKKRLHKEKWNQQWENATSE